MEPTRPRSKSTAPPALADHLVEEILVRVGDPADLARASAACTAFRRLITDPTFLRRYRALHPPMLLGFLDPHPVNEPPEPFVGFFLPADAPHPNAPAAHALAAAADFRFHHLPHWQNYWSPCDARHGLVLLESWDDASSLAELLVSPFRPPELAVCDPLTRSTLVLPPISDSLLESAPVQNSNGTGDLSFDAFFDPSVSYNEAQFRVMWWCPVRCAIFIYSSISNTWTLGGSVGTDLLEPEDFLMPNPLPTYVSFANGRLYWKQDVSDKVIELNISRMEFSFIDLPPDYEEEHPHTDIVVTEDGEGTIWICRLGCTTSNPPCYFIRKMCVDEDEGEDEDGHPVDTPITLPCGYTDFLH